MFVPDFFFYQSYEDLWTRSTQLGGWVGPCPTPAGSSTAWPVMHETATRQLYHAHSPHEGRVHLSVCQLARWCMSPTCMSPARNVYQGERAVYSILLYVIHSIVAQCMISLIQSVRSSLIAYKLEAIMISIALNQRRWSHMFYTIARTNIV